MILARVGPRVIPVLLQLGTNLNMDASQKAQLWGILDAEGAGSVNRESIYDLLEMLVDPDSLVEPNENGLLEGLRAVSQQVFRDTETVQVDAPAVYAALDRLSIPAKDEILVQLKGIERAGKISRTKLDDLLYQLEEVMSNSLEFTVARCRP